MVDDDGGVRLVRAGQSLADSWRRFWFDDGTEEIAGRLAEAGGLYDSVADQAAPPGDAAPGDLAPGDAAPGDVEVAATIAIGRSTIAAFALRLAVDVDHDLNSGWDWDDEGPPLGEMEWDEDGVTAALAAQSVAAARAALDADPDDPLVPLQLGHALTWIGDRAGAVTAYEEALRRDPWDGTAHECLERLEVTPAEPPPAGAAGDPVSRRPYGFAVLREQGRISHSDWFEERRLFGTLSAARADADACLRDTGDLEREFLEGMMKLELEIHRPGRPVTTYDLIARVPDAPDAGPFDIDWSGIPLDQPPGITAARWAPFADGRQDLLLRVTIGINTETRPDRAPSVHPMVIATVREWSDEEGWGVLDSPETPGGCFGHFSNIQVTGFRTLSPGQRVDLTWEAPGFEQDGYDYRAVSIVPRPADS